MKPTSYLRIATLALPLLLASCGSSQEPTGMESGSESGLVLGGSTETGTSTNTQKQTSVAANEPAAQPKTDTKAVMEKVNENTQSLKFVTSKVRFSVEVGQQKISLTGNLKMKRDDVIRLQLMAFGFVEAGRLEFTPEYVLLMDRINKQYLKAPYVYIDFLRNSGINFYTLQGLFWNELFLPGQKSVSKSDMSKFTSTSSDGDLVLSYDQGRMSYSWLANESDGLIRMANVLYKDRLNGNSQLNWDYQGFETFEKKKFPTDMSISLTTGKTDVKLGIVLNYLGSETDWETRTAISDKYREVSVDEILRRFMSM